MNALRGRLPLVVGLSGLTAGLVTVGYVLEREKRAALGPRSQLDRVLGDRVVMFGTTQCSFCSVASQVFDKAGIKPTVIYLDKPALYAHLDMPELAGQLMQRTSCRTVPQIFIDGKFVGGATELQELRDQGALTKLQQ